MAAAAQVLPAIAAPERDPTDAPTAATLALGLAITARAQRVPVATRRDGSGLAASRADIGWRGVARYAQRLADLGAGVDRSPTVAAGAVFPGAGVAARTPGAFRAAIAVASIHRFDTAACSAWFGASAFVATCASGLPVDGSSVDRLGATTVDALGGVVASPAAAADPLIGPTRVEQLDGAPASGAARDHQHLRAGIYQGSDQRAHHLRWTGVTGGQRFGMVEQVSGQPGKRSGGRGDPFRCLGHDLRRQRWVGGGDDSHHGAEPVLLPLRRGGLLA